MVPYKRPATDKSGIPMYQHGATTYQQLMQLQQPFVPVSCEYPPPVLDYTSHPFLNYSTTTTTTSSATTKNTIESNISHYSSAIHAYPTSDYYVLKQEQPTMIINNKHQQQQKQHSQPIMLSPSNSCSLNPNASASFRDTSQAKERSHTSVRTGEPHYPWIGRTAASLLFPPPPPVLQKRSQSVSFPARNRNSSEPGLNHQRFHPYRQPIHFPHPHLSLNNAATSAALTPSDQSAPNINYVTSPPPSTNGPWSWPDANPCPTLPLPQRGSDGNSFGKLPSLDSKALNHNYQMINWTGNAILANNSFFHKDSNNNHSTKPNSDNDVDVNDTAITLVPSRPPWSPSCSMGNKKPSRESSLYKLNSTPDDVDNVVARATSQIKINNNNIHLINRNHDDDYNTKINSCDSNNNNSVIIVTTSTMTVAPSMMTTITTMMMTPTSTKTTNSSPLYHHPTSSSTPLVPMNSVAGTPSNSSTPGLPSAAVAYAAAAAAAAASQSANQSQSLLALSTVSKAHVASESASSAIPVTNATTTTVVVAEGNGDALSPSQAGTPPSASQSGDHASADSSEEVLKDIGLGVGSDSNNNSVYLLAGKGGDDNNNISTSVAESTATPPLPPVDEVKTREISSPPSIVPRVSPSPIIVYSSAAASYPTTVSYPHAAVSAHQHTHATQSYGMPISANAMYGHPSGALMGHHQQHMMKMMPQNFSSKPLTAVAAYPPQYAAHMAQMSKSMMSGVMPGSQQVPNSVGHAAQTQQNVAQLAAAYAQYQHHANAAVAAASSAQTGVGAHQFTHRYTTPGLNGQTSMLTAAGQPHAVQPTPQLFPGYARAPAPPQHMFVQPPHLMRPQMPGQSAPQFYPGNFFYPGYPQVGAGGAGMGPAGLASPLAAATASSAGVSPNMHAANYQAIQAVQQAQSANSTGSAIGLNPYKKMKTS